MSNVKHPMFDIRKGKMYVKNMRRKELIAADEYYHLLGRGNNKQDIFFDKRDYIRFLFLILYFQAPTRFPQVGRYVSHFVKHRVFDKVHQTATEVAGKRYVELVGFCLMSNHYHLLVKNVEEDGISRYMQRVLNSHTKYFNTKYERSGHLFQGPYKAVHIESDKQLQYLSTYIHRNPRELKRWRGKEHQYPWSSFQDYVSENRWGELLVSDIILDSYKDARAYKKFVDTSSAKLDRFVDEEVLQ